MFEVQIKETVTVTSDIVNPWGAKGKVNSTWKVVPIQVINAFAADKPAVEIFEEYCVSVDTKLTNNGQELSPEAARNLCIEHNWLGGKMAQDWNNLMVRGAPKK